MRKTREVKSTKRFEMIPVCECFKPVVRCVFPYKCEFVNECKLVDETMLQPSQNKSVSLSVVDIR